LKEAIHVKEKQKKASKPLFEDVETWKGDETIFLSPTELIAARDLQSQKQEETKAFTARKQELKIQR